MRNRVSNIIVLSMFILLAACSGDQASQTVSKERIDNPAAANDSVPQNTRRPSGGATPDKTVFAAPEGHTHVEGQNSTDVEEPSAGDLYDEDESEPEPTDRVAFVDDGDEVVEWAAPAGGDYSQADVVISLPDGGQLKRRYGEGQPMVLDESLPDGLYHWESVVTPKVDPLVRQEMAQVRESGNFEAEQALIKRLRANGSLPTEAEANENRQSGSFSVINGIATPNSAEVSAETGEEGGQ
ncbi:MAG: hypothetical protein HKN85_03530 [Gammaproteobacteria bacterium]|nr:hypothetical protein [Gammaproteobacteria bacterium]